MVQTEFGLVYYFMMFATMLMLPICYYAYKLFHKLLNLWIMHSTFNRLDNLCRNNSESISSACDRVFSLVENTGRNYFLYNLYTTFCDYVLDICDIFNPRSTSISTSTPTKCPVLRDYPAIKKCPVLNNVNTLKKCPAMKNCPELQKCPAFANHSVRVPVRTERIIGETPTFCPYGSTINVDTCPFTSFDRCPTGAKIDRRPVTTAFDTPVSCKYNPSVNPFTTVTPTPRPSSTTFDYSQYLPIISSCLDIYLDYVKNRDTPDVPASVPTKPTQTATSILLEKLTSMPTRHTQSTQSTQSETATLLEKFIPSNTTKPTTIPATTIPTTTTTTSTTTTSTTPSASTRKASPTTTTIPLNTTPTPADTKSSLNDILNMICKQSSNPNPIYKSLFETLLNVPETKQTTGTTTASSPTTSTTTTTSPFTDIFIDVEPISMRRELFDVDSSETSYETSWNEPCENSSDDNTCAHNISTELLRSLNQPEITSDSEN